MSDTMKSKMEQDSSVCDGCLSPVGNKKQLPCAHKLCSKCLQRCIGGKESRTLVCSSCHSEWSIKMSKEKRAIKLQKQTPPMCKVCKTHSTSSEYTDRCLGCNGSETAVSQENSKDVHSQSKTAVSQENSKDVHYRNEKRTTGNYCNSVALSILLGLVCIAPVAVLMKSYANEDSISTEESDYFANNADQMWETKDDFLKDKSLETDMSEQSEENTSNDNEYNTLELEKTFYDKYSPLHHPMGISVSPTGDIAVADWNRNRVTVFDSIGNVKFELDTRLDLDYKSTSNPVSVTIAPSGHFYVTDFNPWVNVYHPDGSYLFQIPIESPQESVHPNAPPIRHLRGYGIGTDKHGRVLVGEYWTNRVSIHTPKGGLMTSFNVSVEPRFISVFQNKISIACYDCRRPIQVVNYFGQLLVTLQNPFEDQTWSTRGVCFTKHRGDILVAGKSKSRSGIYRFSSKGEFVDCVTQDVDDPGGIATSDDGKKVFVIDKKDVKVFRWK